MVQRRSQLRFALEALPGLLIDNIRREEFNRDGSIEIRIEGTIDDSHAALPQPCINAVFAQHGPDLDRSARLLGFHEFQLLLLRGCGTSACTGGRGTLVSAPLTTRTTTTTATEIRLQQMGECVDIPQLSAFDAEQMC